MKVSLIMATLGRHDECAKFLDSLSHQTYRGYELIIADQNEGNFLDDVINKYQEKIAIKHLRLDCRGLSKARNIALPYADGDIIAFPDDDCLYFPDTLEKVIQAFVRTGADVITGCTTHHYGNISNPVSDVVVNKYNIWKKSISYTIFMKRSVKEKLHGFDETLGVGSGTQYGSGEETDYLLYALEKGFKLVNTKDISIYHPSPVYSNYNKAFLYSKGRMRVLAKHNYPNWFVYANKIYPVCKILVFFYNKTKRRYLWQQFKGRL